MNETENKTFRSVNVQLGLPPSTRRTYRKPTLQAFGKMHQLTQAKSGMNPDGGSGMTMV